MPYNGKKSGSGYSKTRKGRTVTVKVKATSKHKGYTQEREDLGLPGKGPKLIPIMEKGSLTKFGYSTKKSDQARHAALDKAINAYGKLTVFHKLLAQVNLRKRTQPKAREVFEEDAKWVDAKLQPEFQTD